MSKTLIHSLFQQVNKQNVSGKRIFILRRVSSRRQRGTGNLDDQRHLIGLAKQLGGIVVGTRGFTARGSDPDFHNDLLTLAEECQAEAILAESVDRFIRHPDFCPHNFSLQPTTKQLRTLKERAGKIALLTAVDPSASPEAVRAYQSERVKKKRTKGHEQRKRLKQKAINLKKRGVKADVIARRLGVSRRTVFRWVKG